MPDCPILNDPLMLKNLETVHPVIKSEIFVFTQFSPSAWRNVTFLGGSLYALQRMLTLASLPEKGVRMSTHTKEEKNNKTGKTHKGVFVVVFLLFISLRAQVSPSYAYSGEEPYLYQTTPEIPPSTLVQIASTYAPVLWFYKDSLKEEPFTLIEADYFLTVSQKDSSGNYKLMQDGFSGAKHLQDDYKGMRNPVYVHLTTDTYNGTPYIAIQYWFHYLYNYGNTLSALNFDHEGEWEMIEVILQYDESLLRGTSFPEPALIAYSRHSGGETHAWENEWVEKGEGFHPVAYIAYGTHAAYFKDLGWNEDLNKGFSLTYTDMTFIPLQNEEWLHLSGRWGGNENSPLGPLFQEDKWGSPVGWAMRYMENYLLHLEHPAHLLITNEEGQRIGFLNGEFVNEIQDAYSVVTEGHEYYYLPQGDYSVEISGAERGSDFDAFVNREGRMTQISYVVSHITRAYTEVGTHAREYALRMDRDGDGKIDLTVNLDVEYKRAYVVPLLLVGLAFFVFAAYRRHEVSKPSARLRMARYALKALTVLFLLLWLCAVFADFMWEYEVEFLQMTIAFFLFAQIASVFKEEYSRGRTVQEFFTTGGWSLLGVWLVFKVLKWVGWFGAMEVGIDIDRFLVPGVAFLLLGYTIVVARYLAGWGVQRLLLAVGCLSLLVWGGMKVLFIYTGYADYVLGVGIAAFGMGVIVGLRRSASKKEERDVSNQQQERL